MPIYEYVCKKCGEVIDLLQKMGTESAGIPCPKCGEHTLTKKLSVTSPAQIAKGAAGCPAPSHQGPCGGCCAGCQH